MKRFIALAAALTALLALAVPAVAGHDNNPSDKVASYTYDLGELNDSGVEGTVRIKALPGRNSFSGARKLCGAYVNREDVESRRRTLAT